MITKTELMAIVASGRSRESFEHSILGQFDISAMRLVAPQIGQPVVVPLELIIDHIRETRVFEEARILQLNMEDCLFDPGIMITTIREIDGQIEHTMVDGHHRALRLHREGRISMRFWEIPLEKAIRPGEGWGRRPDLDWGDALIDGFKLQTITTQFDKIEEPGKWETD